MHNYLSVFLSKMTLTKTHVCHFVNEMNNWIHGFDHWVSVKAKFYDIFYYFFGENFIHDYCV